MDLRKFGIAVVLSALSVFSLNTSALEIVVPNAPGGPSDYMARQIADHVGKHSTLSLVVVNKPGASSNIGYSYFVNCKSCLVLAMSTMESNKYLQPESYPENVMEVAKLVYDFGTSPNAIVVSATRDIQTFEQLLSYSSKKTLIVGHSGSGSVSYQGMKWLCKQVSKCLEVPYKSGSFVLQDVYGGRVDVYAGPSFAIEKIVATGKAKIVSLVDLGHWVRLYGNNVDESTIQQLRESLDKLPNNFYEKLQLKR